MKPKTNTRCIKWILGIKVDAKKQGIKGDISATTMALA
jgi:hypothetical protein